jgi:xanthosine utilization system XapX-like protein
MPKKITIILWVITGLISLMVGILVGIAIAGGFELENKLTMDGVVAAIIALLAILAGSVLIPAVIQPITQRKKSENSILHENLKNLMGNIEETQSILTELYLSKVIVKDHDRKLIMGKYTKIVNYANLVRKHSKGFTALDDFNEKVYEPLTGAQTNFAEKVQQKQKITEAKYIAIRDSLDAVLYALIDIRYEIK